MAIQGAELHPDVDLPFAPWSSKTQLRSMSPDAHWLFHSLLSTCPHKLLFATLRNEFDIRFLAAISMQSRHDALQSILNTAQLTTTRFNS